MYRKWHLLEKAELNIYFPNYFPAKLPDKLHCPQDYPKFESKERFYLGQYSVKSGLFWVSFFKDALWEKSGYEGHTKYLISNVIGGVWKTQF